METCITSYSLPAVLEWAPKVWDSVKFEVWNGENDEFIRGALNVIHGITRALSSQADWNDTENPSVKIVLSILNECKERLIDSRQRHVVETGKILYAVATASPYGFSWATRMLLPSMFTHWQGLVSKSDKTAILGIFNRILEARLLVEQELEAKLRDEASSQATPRGDGLSPPTRADYLSQSKDRLASTLNETRRNLVDDIYFSAMTEKISDSPDGTQFRVTTIQGLVFLMSIQDLLSDFEKGAIIESLNEILLQPNQIDSLSEAAASALQKISTGDPVKFQQITLVNFMSKLPKSISADKRQRKSELDSVIDLLDSLTKIACTATCNAETGQSATETDPKHYVFDVYQKALLSKLFDIIKQDGQLPYANVILGAIYRGLVSFDGVLDKELKSTHSAKPFVSSLHPYAWIPSTLLQQFVKIKHGPTNSETPYVGLDLPLDKDEVVDRFVSLLGDIITLALRSNQTTAENNFLNSRNVQSPNVSSQIWSLFVENAPENLNSTQQDLIYGPGDKCLANALSMSLVAGVRREVSLRYQQPQQALC
jgi:DNA repair/transcription protein MET18/MMS19